MKIDGSDELNNRLKRIFWKFIIKKIIWQNELFRQSDKARPNKMD